MIRSRPLPACLIMAAISAWAVAVWRSGVLAPDIAQVEAGAVLLCRDGLPLRVRLGAGDIDSRPVARAAISPRVIQALIAAEDKRFLTHPGIDPLATARALYQNLRHGRRISGASTLSTQVVRLAELRPRTPSTKVIEAVKALHMEQSIDKQSILEQYLNRAPFGGNLSGIEAASRIYFDKAAADLTLAEAALLAGLPQAPSRLRPDRHPAAARKRMTYVLDRMRANGFITAREQADALRQPMAVRPHPRPFEAPHFCDLVLRWQPHHRGPLPTTLDRDLQHRIEQLVARQAPVLRQQRIANGAVVVIDVATGDVRAMVGSFDYHDPRQAGMVNHAIAPRSPGSALKPLIYAMALDQGMITPGQLLDDSPLRFPDTTPDNFDKTFRGRITVREALIQSLNIPALRVTSHVGLQETLDGLRALGLETLRRPAEEYGLGIALGGGEVTLLDLANAYACLAREGLYRPYRLVETDAADQPPRRRFSAEAAYMVTDMLSGEERSMAVFGHVAAVELPQFAWKTGTSSGFRDAWTIAWTPRTVVGVWLGNPDGSGSPALVGAVSAAPLAGDILRTIERGHRFAWYVAPAGLARRTREDGSPEWCIPGISMPVRHAARADPPLRIATPVDGSLFQLADDAQFDQTLALQAEGPDSHERLHWFINGRFAGITTCGQPLEWPLRRGRWTVVCVAAPGRRAQATITVR